MSRPYRSWISDIYSVTDNGILQLKTVETYCALCGDKVYTELDPQIRYPDMVIEHFHVRDNTPLCRAR